MKCVAYDYRISTRVTIHCLALVSLSEKSFDIKTNFYFNWEKPYSILYVISKLLLKLYSIFQKFNSFERYAKWNKV